MIKYYLLFSLICFYAFFSTQTAVAGSPVVITTFESIGISWDPNDGSSAIACKVEYKVTGQDIWKSAQSLWFDTNSGEYRGSIVLLNPGTTYDIRLTIDGGGSQQIIQATTWSEKFPVGSTTNVSDSYNTLTINKSGTAAGYRLYTVTSESTGTIDVASKKDYCINIKSNVHHVILRGLTLKNAIRFAIYIETGVHDLVVEGCDISGWGINNYDAGIYARSGTNIYRIIVQGNKIHHPRVGSSSWDTGHPKGPSAIYWVNSLGNNVIRYNNFYSNYDRMFNDILGGCCNFSVEGFPGQNSDIYSNALSHSWDDGIEAEGGGENVRIWANYIDNTFIKIAIAPVSVGPIYIFRNILNTSRKSASQNNPNLYGRGPFIKAGGGRGRTYIYHNTILQDGPPDGKSFTLGCDGAIIASGGELYELITRNNIFENLTTRRVTYEDSHVNSCTNDWDYDLYTGRILNNCASDPHQADGGIEAAPIYDSDNGYGEFALRSDGAGYDDGVVLPNFNDNYSGTAPDMGAFETGSIPMKFGIEAIDKALDPPKNLRIVK